MRQIERIQLPDSYIRGIRVLPRVVNGKELVCEAYRISTVFPDNIVLLRKSVLIYCIDFHQEPDPEHPGFPKFFLTGKIFQIHHALRKIILAGIFYEYMLHIPCKKKGNFIINITTVLGAG